MTKLAILVPSRERPHRLERLLHAVRGTAVLDVRVVAGVDIGDPRQAEYAALDAKHDDLTLFQGPRRSLSGWTNLLAEKVLAGALDGEAPDLLASMGDDHVPETGAWDQRCAVAIEALAGNIGGWAWGPDGFRRDTLPTWWVMSAEVARRLGYVMLPRCEHMYVDNATQVLAEQSQRACYLPDVLVRHEHFLTGRAPRDDTYTATNSTEQYARDAAAFTRWRNMGGLSDDVAKLLRE